jgi:hypothetical protein
MSDPIIDVGQLFDDAKDEGIITPPSHTLLSTMAGRLAQTMPALKVTPSHTRMTCALFIVDNTPSMTYRHKNVQSSNAEQVVAGYNFAIECLRGASAGKRATFEIMPLLLNHNKHYVRSICGTDEFQWTSVENAPLLKLDDFIFGDYTPLYERVIFGLGSAFARCKYWRDQGIQANTDTMIQSDGEDNMDSPTYTADAVAALVADMYGAECHIIRYAGVQGRLTIDFKQVGRQMGIKEEFNDPMPTNPAEFRARYQAWSQSMAQGAPPAPKK